MIFLRITVHCHIWARLQSLLDEIESKYSNKVLKIYRFSDFQNILSFGVYEAAKHEHL